MVFFIFNFGMYTFVIKKSILINQAVLDISTTPMLGLMFDKIEVDIVEADPSNLSVIISVTFLT